MKPEAWTEPRAFHEEEVLRWPDVHSMVKLSRNTILRMERSGKFPKRFPLTDYSIGWLKSEVLAWMRSKGAGSTVAAGK